MANKDSFKNRWLNKPTPEKFADVIVLVIFILIILDSLKII